MKKKASQQNLLYRWKRKVFSTLLFSFCLGSFVFFQVRFNGITASLESLKPRLDQKPQIAFLFIARNRLPLEFVWDAFFQGQDGKFSIFVHSRPGFVLSEATTQSKYFLDRQVNDGIQVDWGEATIIEAERVLLRHALRDPFNHRFVFLSDTCIPLYSFSYTYNYMSTPTSFVDSFADAKDSRYNPRMDPVIPVHNWRKGSQWVVLNRKHAEIVVNDTTVFPIFQQHCRRKSLPEFWRDRPVPAEGWKEHNCIPDEHYVQTLLTGFTMPKHYRPAGKKKEGNAARYMTRSQALKHLQVNLNLFRRLCIVKGIFPREPKKKVKGNHHTYYHVKDISFLQHEPLLEKFREIKTYQKKVKKAKAKKNEELARLLLTRQPTYKLDRLIRERYPTFIDSLRDLDDCLTMVHLFAVLSASDREKLEVKRVHNCRRLSHEWQAYISRCHALRKVFVSVKGIYYQAELEGQKITWLTPHAVQQVFTNDVDFGVLLTFLEFYETLLAFINFKLYHSLNVKYPPILDSRLEALAADLYALSRYIDASSRGIAVEHKVDASSISQSNEREELELRLAQLQHQLPSSEPGALMHLVADNNKEVEEDEETRQCKSLFKDLKFFLSREVPRESLLFVLPAFGGMVSWKGEGAPFKEDDESITHHIVDKPSAGHMYLSREYVQPQWIYDCVNARIILPTEKYMVGSIPPPHLSPFVDNEAEGYVPDYAETIKRLHAAARNEVLPLPGVGKEDLEDPQNLLYAGVMSRAEEAEAAKNKEKMATQEKQYHEELKMELTGSKVVAPVVAEDEDEESVPAATNTQIAEEDADMPTMLMSRKKRKLYDAMMMGRNRNEERVRRLEQRNRELNAAGQS